MGPVASVRATRGTRQVNGRLVLIAQIVFLLILLGAWVSSRKYCPEIKTPGEFSVAEHRAGRIGVWILTLRMVFSMNRLLSGWCLMPR